MPRLQFSINLNTEQIYLSFFKGTLLNGSVSLFYQKAIFLPRTLGIVALKHGIEQSLKK